MPLGYIGHSSFMNGTLGATLNSGDTSATLTTGHGARFPNTSTNGVYWCLIWATGSPLTGEVIKVNTRATDSLSSITRAQNGTTAQNWASGDNIGWIESVEAVDQRRTDQSGIGTTANLPSTTVSKSGDQYHTTDGVYRYVFNGSVWVPFYGSYCCTQPINGDFTWDNAGAAVLTTAGGGVSITGTGSATGTTNRWRYKAAPTAPYTIDLAFLVNMSNQTFPGVNCGWRNSGSGEAVCFAMNGNFTTGQSYDIYYSNWANSTSGETLLTNLRGFVVPPHPIHIRIEDNNTDLIVSLSPDGLVWQPIVSSGRAAHITPDQVMFGLRESTGTLGPTFRLINWKEA